MRLLILTTTLVVLLTVAILDEREREGRWWAEPAVAADIRCDLIHGCWPWKTPTPKPTQAPTPTCPPLLGC